MIRTQCMPTSSRSIGEKARLIFRFACASDYVVEIEDRGLGMGEAEPAEANRGLVDSPEIPDPAVRATIGHMHVIGWLLLTGPR
jgi:hypothetical protein